MSMETVFKISVTVGVLGNINGYILKKRYIGEFNGFWSFCFFIP